MKLGISIAIRVYDQLINTCNFLINVIERCQNKKQVNWNMIENL